MFFFNFRVAKGQLFPNNLVTISEYRSSGKDLFTHLLHMQYGVELCIDERYTEDPMKHAHSSRFIEWLDTKLYNHVPL